MWTQPQAPDGGFWGELHSATLHPRLLDSINALDFDPLEEALWVGTEGGFVGQLQIPSLDRHCSIPAHHSNVLALKSLGEAALALSSTELTVHSSGGTHRLTYVDEVGDMAAMALEQRGSRVVLGRGTGGGLVLFDLKRGTPGSTVDTGGRGVVGLCGPIGRGAMVLATADGYLWLVDPRTGYKPEHSLLAHGGGFAALDAGGDLVGTCGYSNRMGRVTLDTFAKVFDVRMTPRMLCSVPFAPGPSLLRFHPRFNSTMLLASAGGAFTMADAQGMSASGLYQVETEGDILVSAAISSSGECLAFGGSGGYVHLWAPSADPSVNQLRQALTPPEPPTPLVSLGEEDPLSLAPTYFPWDAAGLLSDVEPFETVAVGLPPRVVDASLLKGMKQSDFVGYIPNTHYQRGAPYGAATRAAAAKRNQRVQPQPGTEELAAARAERVRRRAEAGGVMLPGRYKRVAIKQQQGVRFEEFDFSYYNRTPFTGLENDLANCYTNALLQARLLLAACLLFCLAAHMLPAHAALLRPDFHWREGPACCDVLFFTPATRDALLQHVPDPAAELSLTCEMSFLFRMLATAASGTVCQAANLLRALRQNKEAAGLGLLEGVKGERGASDIEVEAKKERSLSKRVQSLSRFLLEALNKEGSVAGRQSLVEAVYGLVQRQRTQCLSRPNRADQIKESRMFQVDLQYPPPKERPTAATAAAPPAAAAAAAGATPASPSAPAVATAVAAAEGAAAARPSFAGLLQQSLKVQAEMRAWFDEEVKYQYVRQTRVPRSLPQVLVVNTGLQDREDLAWWRPYTYTALDLQGEAVTRQRAWLPAAVAVTADPEGWTVAAQEADSAEALLAAAAQQAVPPGGQRAVYELTAVVALVRQATDCTAGHGHQDEDEAEEAAGQEYEGHLVAHIKVPPTYFDAQQQSPASLSRAPSDLDTSAAGGGASDAAAGPAGGVGSSSSSHPSTPRKAAPGVLPHEIASLLLPGAGAPSSAAAAAASATSAAAAAAAAAAALSGTVRQPLSPKSPLQAMRPAAGAPPYSPQSPPPLSVTETEVIRNASDSLVAAMADPHSTPPYKPSQQFNWMVFNDFHITPSMPEEVAELYGGQKLPCLLYYTQVEAVQRAAQCPPKPPVPVLTPDGFLALCRMPPLQGPKVRLHKATFSPLLPSELPQPGSLFALDAEFVAFAPAEKALRRGLEVEVRPPRLGLARVSVLRGQGPAKCTACIDDYIKCAEPVYDYLTKFRRVPGHLGLVPGDLDPARSPHYLTTLKRAYLKLRHLVDAGAVFVGHGLKKDFRMINIVVPPNQIVDTVDLFHAKRSRKLSLRFLASYLLRSSIQEHTHDSIEDAATALRLYDVYQQLVREGAFEAKLQEMYDWGKRFGWEPVIWKDGQPHPAPQPPPAAAMAAAGSIGNSGGPGQQHPMLLGRGGPGMASAGGPAHMQHHQQHTQQQQQQARGMHGGGGGPRGQGRR
ncbi:PAN2-PAN3 deadenylation complex catalytic subunit pan2 [Chlorella vulgaris]